MKTIEVFDPAMCCSTGVCGPSVDPVLARFAADLDWLAGQGVTVERFNLAQQPGAFAERELVSEALRAKGEDCLPLVLADGQAVSEGGFPSRAELAGFAGVEQPAAIYTQAADTLLGAAVPAPVASPLPVVAANGGCCCSSGDEADPAAAEQSGSGSCC